MPGWRPPALHAGNRFPLANLAQARRVDAYPDGFRHTARNDCDNPSNENAWTELAAASALDRELKRALSWGATFLDHAA